MSQEEQAAPARDIHSAEGIGGSTRDHTDANYYKRTNRLPGFQFLIPGARPTRAIMLFDVQAPCHLCRMTVVTGTLAEPDLAPFVGQQLHIETILVPPDGTAPRTRLIDQDMLGALLFVESITPAGAHVHGTAFLVAPGIALTAWHTIKDWEESGHFGEPGHTIFACGAIGAELRAWEVRSISGPVAGGDVAMMILAPRFPLGEQVALCHFALAAAFPPIGSEVTALGMRLEPAEAVLPLLEGEQQLPPISIATVVSTGPIEDRYLTGIPRIAAPCFAANVFSIGGMSGGPVFDETGHVIGIVSESIGNDDPDNYVTFVSLVWPATLFEFEGVYPQGMFPAGSQLRSHYVREGWRVLATAAGELAFLEGGNPDFIGPPHPPPGFGGDTDANGGTV